MEIAALEEVEKNLIAAEEAEKLFEDKVKALEAKKKMKEESIEMRRQKKKAESSVSLPTPSLFNLPRNANEEL